MSKIITCVSGPGLIKCKEQIDGKPFGELRLDLVNLTLEEINMLWKHADEWILTLRKEFTANAKWKEIFQSCIALNPSYVDIDFQLEQDIKTEVSEWVKNSPSQLMFSYHNFNETPKFESLSSQVQELFASGADVAKVAVMASEEEDNLVVMDLYREFPRLVAFCMGEHGKESRITSLFFGEKLSYVSPSAEEQVAPGQFTYNELYDLINFGFDE